MTIGQLTVQQTLFTCLAACLGELANQPVRFDGIGKPGFCPALVNAGAYGRRFYFLPVAIEKRQLSTGLVQTEHEISFLCIRWLAGLCLRVRSGRLSACGFMRHFTDRCHTSLPGCFPRRHTKVSNAYRHIAEILNPILTICSSARLFYCRIRLSVPLHFSCGKANGDANEFMVKTTG